MTWLFFKPKMLNNSILFLRRFGEEKEMIKIEGSNKKPLKGMSKSCLNVILLLSAYIIFSLGISSKVNAAEFNIPSGNVTALIDAINTANSNEESDTINLASGSYVLTSVDNDTDGPNGLPSITSEIFIIGSGKDSTVIKRDIHNKLRFRIFHINSFSGVVNIEGLAVKGGNTDGWDGGGIFNNGHLILENTIISKNSDDGGSFGGGIFNNADGTMIIKNSVIAENTAWLASGILNEGTMNIIKSKISDNGRSEQIGGIWNRGVMTIKESIVSKNEAAGSPGIKNDITGEMIIEDCTISDNFDLGPGIDNLGSMTVTNSTISNNDGAYDPGGIANAYYRLSGVIKIINSTIANNKGLNGAGVHNGSGNMTIINSTIANNEGYVEDAGLVNDNGSVFLQNTILANNIAPPLRGLLKDTDGTDCFGEITSLGNNLIGDTDGCTIIDARGPSGLPDKKGEAGLGPFTDTGVPGKGHFPLLRDSRAIDAGKNDAGLATDQLGNFRPIDGNSDGNLISDIGSVEFFTLVNVSDFLTGTPNQDSFSFNPIPVPDGPGGTFSFEIDFCNTDSNLLVNLKSETIELTNDNVLLNRDIGTPLGIGSTLTFPFNSGLSDSILESGECVTIHYKIGLSTNEPFSFFVDVFGVVTLIP